MAFQIARGVVVAGRYRVEREIGAGGMGVVWAAKDLRTRRPVAMKVIRGSSHSHSELRRRFLREARAASAVIHPNVVEVLDVFDLSEDSPVLVMELLEGETLASLLEREERLPLERCAEYLVPAVSAVGAAHARGIVHRDLKPSNIFLAKTHAGTTVKVLDFGIAKLFVGEGEPGFTQNTRTGSTLGTPSYMAPEQATGQKDVDHLADVWAFGVILYECISGIRPIEGDTVGQIVMSLMSTGITPIDQLVPDLPDGVARLVGRMLSRERASRPRDLREPFSVLSRYSRAGAPDFGDPVSVPIDPDDGVVARFAENDRIAPDTSRRRLRVAIVLAAGTATVVGGLILGRNREASEQRTLEPTNVTDVVQRPDRDPTTPARVAPPDTASEPPPAASAAGAATAEPVAMRTERTQRVVMSVPSAAAPSPAPAPSATAESAGAERLAAPPPASTAAASAGFRGGLAEEVPF